MNEERGSNIQSSSFVLLLCSHLPCLCGRFATMWVLYRHQCNCRDIRNDYKLQSYDTYVLHRLCFSRYYQRIETERDSSYATILYRKISLVWICLRGRSLRAWKDDRPQKDLQQYGKLLSSTWLNYTIHDLPNITWHFGCLMNWKVMRVIVMGEKAKLPLMCCWSWTMPPAKSLFLSGHTEWFLTCPKVWTMMIDIIVITLQVKVAARWCSRLSSGKPVGDLWSVSGMASE